MAALHVLAWIWSLPTELVGLLLLPFYTPKSAYFREGCLIIRNDRMVGYTNTIGQTWGRVVFIKTTTDPSYFETIWTHEHTHTKQCDALGPLWMLAYGLASLISLLQGTGGYEGNYFERRARAAAGQDP